MSQDIRKVNDMESLITYFSEKLNWNIDPDDFYDIDDITYEFEAEDLGLKDEAFAKINSLKQLQPLVDDQKWGIFFVEFDSQRFEVSALRKILSGLIPTRRNSAEHAVWDKRDLLFLCTWGSGNQTTIGAAHFEDAEKGLPQIKMISCEPAVEDFTQINIFEQKLAKLRWPSDPTDTAAWREAWASAFTVRYRQVIQDSHTLTVCLAEEAKAIRDRILNTLKVETRNGYVHLLFEKFQNTLIHDMTEQQFADMYAQTIVYGLFSARCMDNTQDDFSPEEAVACIPNTNPFLKSLMQECFSSDRTGSKLSFDELEIGNIVTLLQNTKTDAIIADFNRQTGGGREDPVIHFYEEFLTEYDKAQKVQRGVYYTPQPVVNFIVRAVDDILKSEFGVADGLASTVTKKIKVKRESYRKIKGFKRDIEVDEEVPAIQILDPATGTGTFLRQTILQIYQNFCDARKGMPREKIQEEWNDYVPKHLLPRLNGFELMMAPYAVAHMKLAMVLKDTGYDFHGEERLQVYLTNSLEEPGDSDIQTSFFTDPLAMESIEANGAKKNSGINVVIGNPPYAGESANKGDWIMNLISPYKMEPGGVVRLNERNPKWLNDDYVKFIRLAQMFIQREGYGVLSFICPHGFIDNPTFRGMRWNLASTFSKIYILDLHGNAKKKETTPNGGKDENVFDIQQGVCIMFMIYTPSRKAHFAEIFHADLYGNRDFKYNELNQQHFSEIPWTDVQSVEPFYLFKPSDLAKICRVDTFSLGELFIENTMGFQTHRDSFAIAFTRSEMESRINVLHNPLIGNEDVEKTYDFGTKFDLQKSRTRIQSFSQDEINNKIVSCQYRLFDKRFCFLDESIMDRPRSKVFSHSLHSENWTFGVGRQGLAVGDIEWCLVTISRYPFDANIFRRGGITAAPLYLYSDEFGKEKREPNLNPQIIKAFAEKIHLSFSSEKSTGNISFSPIDMIDYIYAILYSHHYRIKYADALKIDYPQVPYPKNTDYFWSLVEFGSQLRRIHCMEYPLETSQYSFSGAGDNTVEKISFKNGYIAINKSQMFKATPEMQPITSEMWTYTIGGMQPLQKWLKDRKGLKLTEENIRCYLYILEAVKTTMSIMDEIDKIVQF